MNSNFFHTCGKASFGRFALLVVFSFLFVVGSSASEPIHMFTSLNQDRTTLNMGLGFVRSSWRESVFSGSRQVRELGYFPAMDMRLEGSSPYTSYDLSFGLAGGVRSYQGWSTQGFPVYTGSDVRLARFGATYWSDVGSLGALGLRVDVQTVMRRIRDSGAVKGYDEQFVDMLGLVGFRRQWRTEQDDLWKLDFWLGAGPPGWMHLELPGYEAKTLKLGSTRTMEVAVIWDFRPFGASGRSHWRTQLAANYVWKATAAGPQTPIRRSGRILGQAAQPETRQSVFGFQWRLIRPW